MPTIVCPKCGTEVNISEFSDIDNAQCQLCGKILLAEVLEKKQELERQGKSLEFNNEKTKTKTRKFDNLGDDDLFGELEPFEVEGEGLPSLPNEKIEETTDDLDKREFDKEVVETRIEDDGEKKFENPMEKSSLMKKLKDDQDLFGSLDE